MAVRLCRPRTLRAVEDQFWQLVTAGVPQAEAAARVGVSLRKGCLWLAASGGIRPRLKVVQAGERSRSLTLTEREEIAIGLAQGRSIRAIAAALGRAPSTVSREVARNCDRKGSYRGVLAQSRAETRRRRPKAMLLAVRPDLAAVVESGLCQRWSPRQIALSMRRAHPDQPEQWVSHETIYRSLFVQGRGGLRRELHAALRTGRALRRPQAATRRANAARAPGSIPDPVSISERPAEAADRAVPGHWEGDLIMGKDNRSAIGTLVERSTRYCLLLHLGAGKSAENVRDAMLKVIPTLPEHLWRSLTWDRGTEMARHHEITMASGLKIYFCDPHSPWQRGSNENTNGLLRQYFPKGTDLSVHTAEDLAAVAVQLNGRPRETLQGRSPAEALNELLSTPFNTDGVAFIV